MTTNQIAYWQMQESRKHNRATEAQERDNLAHKRDELSHKRDELAETKRYNIAKDSTERYKSDNSASASRYTADQKALSELAKASIKADSDMAIAERKTMDNIEILGAPIGSAIQGFTDKTSDAIDMVKEGFGYVTVPEKQTYSQLIIKNADESGNASLKGGKRNGKR